MPHGTNLFEAFLGIITVGLIIAAAIYFTHKQSAKAEKKPIGQLSNEEIKNKTFEELLDHIDGYTGGNIIKLILAVIIIVGSMLWAGINWLFEI